MKVQNVPHFTLHHLVALVTGVQGKLSARLAGLKVIIRTAIRLMAIMKEANLQCKCTVTPKLLNCAL